MKKVRFLFYISGEYDKFLSKAIAWWSGLWNKKTLRTSHEELEFCSRTPAEIESLARTACPERTCPEQSRRSRGELCRSAKTTPAEILNQSGLCFSSATRGSFTGVRFAPAGEILKHSERWSFIEVDVDDQIEQKMFDSARSIVGKPYDYIAILGFCLPVHIQDQHSWFCSESVNWVAFKAGLLNKAYRWSPLASLNMMLKKNFGLLRSLATNAVL